MRQYDAIWVSYIITHSDNIKKRNFIKFPFILIKRAIYTEIFI